MREHFRGKEVTTAEAKAVLFAEGFYTDEDYDEYAERGFSNDIRNRARKPHYDEDGNRIELVNFKREGWESGELQQVFAYVDEISEEDLQKVMKDRLARRGYFTDEFVRLAKIYDQRFGVAARKQFQLRLNLDFDFEIEP